MERPFPAYHGDAPFVFVSYSHADSDVVFPEIAWLRSQGIRIWYDEGISPGGKWRTELADRIRDARLFLFFVSPQSARSVHCEREVDFAIDEGKRLLVVYLEETTLPSGLALSFASLQAIVRDDVSSDVFREKLLAGTAAAMAGQAHPKPPTTANRTAVAESRRRHPKAVRWVVAALGLAVVSVAALSWHAIVTAETQDPNGEVSAAATNRKTLVVLPFENLSPDPNESYFVEGIHADIVATVSRLSGLTVISRRAAMRFDESTAALPEIAQLLNATHAVTGSVRRVGENVRILLELRRADDELLLWSLNLDRRLEDILGLQREVATEVARVLEAEQLSGLAASAKLYTSDPQTYDLFLRALRSFWSARQDLSNMRRSIAAFQDVLERDPDFAWAAFFLSNAHAQAWEWDPDPVSREPHAEQARRWAEVTTELDSASGDAAMSYYLTRIAGEPAAGLELAQRAARLLPNDTLVHMLQGLAYERLGRYAQALDANARVLEIDPFEPRALYNTVLSMTLLRRPDQLDTRIDRLLDMDIDRPGIASNLAEFRYRLTGMFPADYASFSPDRQVTWLLRARRWEDAAQASAAALDASNVSDALRCDLLQNRARALAQLGRDKEAVEAASAALILANKLANGRTPPRNRRGILALANAGQLDEAVAAAQRYVDEIPQRAGPPVRWSRQRTLAQVLARNGQIPESVALIAELLGVPSGLTVPMLQTEFDWDRLRGDVEFEALLADPKSSAPL